MDFAAHEFIIHNGPSKWLHGLTACPSKLAAFAAVNALLCHRPWLLTKEHITALLAPGKDSWSITELVQAIVIAVTFHSLSSFVWGLGVSIEQELELVRIFRLSKLSDTSIFKTHTQVDGIVEEDTPSTEKSGTGSNHADLAGWLQARLQQDPVACVAENAPQSEQDSFNEAADGVADITTHTVASCTKVVVAADGTTSAESSQFSSSDLASQFSPFLGATQLNYVDFNVRSKE